MKFIRKDRKEIYKSNWINLYVDKVETETGKLIPEYHVLDYKNKSVCVIVENSEGKLLFIKANRYITNDSQWEIPAGGIEENEDELTAGKREVKEETGYDINDIQKIYTYMPSNGMSNQVIDICLAKLDINQKEQDIFDAEEVQKVQWIDINRINEMIEKNEIIDGPTLIAILLYKQKK